MFCFLQTWNTLWILPEHDFCYGKKYFIRKGAKSVSKLDCLDWALRVSQEEQISSPHVKSEDLVNKINALQNWSFRQLTHTQKGPAVGETLSEKLGAHTEWDQESLSDAPVPETHEGPCCAFLPKFSTSHLCYCNYSRKTWESANMSQVFLVGRERKRHVLIDVASIKWLDINYSSWSVSVNNAISVRLLATTCNIPGQDYFS